MSQRKKLKRGTKATKTAFGVDLKNEIAAVILFTVFVLLALSFYFNQGGILGESVKSFFMGLLGYASFLTPVYILILGVYLTTKKNFKGVRVRLLFMFLFILNSASMLHLCFYNDENMDKLSTIAGIYFSGAEGIGGGLLGAAVAQPLVYLTGKIAAWVILLSFLLIILIVLTNYAPINFIVNKIGQLRERKRAKISEEVEVAAVEPEIDLNKKKKQFRLFGEDELVRENAKEDKVMEEDEVHIKPQDEENEDISIKIYPAEDGAKKGRKTAEKEAVKEESDEKKVSGGEIENFEISPLQERIEYLYPPIDLLNKVTPPKGVDKPQDLRESAKKLIETLKSFGVEARVLEVTKGPTVTRFEIQPSAGVKVSKIVNLADDIALNLAAAGVRIEAPIPGKAAVGIEIPNSNVSLVALRDVIDSDEFKNFESKTAFAMGKDISGNSVIADISKMPHLLIAGATGSGKSVCINTLITSILYKADPNEVKLLLIDPKVVELGVYNGIPHLLIPVVTDPRRAAGALNWAVTEMTRRYRLFAEASVRDIYGFNEFARLNDEPTLEQIIIIIDELADLMMVAPKDVEEAICRLAQMARAAGMHLVIATQRPSVDVITGVIKANIPSRISFAVSSQIDSRTILDMAGAEKLLGRGDMLYLPIGASKPKRIQGAYISDKEVERVVEYVKMSAKPQYDEDILEHIENEGVEQKVDPGEADELLPEAIELVVETQMASVSLIQRRLSVGHSRAGRTIDQMEARGIIGPHEGSKPRQVLITKEQYYEMLQKGQL